MSCACGTKWSGRQTVKLLRAVQRLTHGSRRLRRSWAASNPTNHQTNSLPLKSFVLTHFDFCFCTMSLRSTLSRAFKELNKSETSGFRRRNPANALQSRLHVHRASNVGFLLVWVSECQTILRSQKDFTNTR